jgi:tripartite-type tricarboxylate transporter receptor subunit TctC
MTSLTRRGFVASATTAIAATAAGLRPGFSQGAYPTRPITLICPWGAGGGTDATARIIAQVLEQKLGQPVNVVNRTGGNGVVGHAAISSATPDGYTLGLITVEITMMHWQGLTELTPRSYQALSLMNVDAPAIQVKADSPYKNVKELADAIKAAPLGKLKASGTGQGGIWHLALVGWLQSLGLQPNHVAWVPSNGAAPAMQDLAAGGLDIVPCSLPEARPMIDAGRAKSLAILAPERNPQFPNVPTLDEQMGPHKSVGVWRGIAGPKGLPADIQAKLGAALKEVYDSKEYNEFMTGRGFGVRWAPGAEFAQFMDEADRQMGEAMKAAGLAKT